MLNRSINRDYDIPEHREGLLVLCTSMIIHHANSLHDVDYDPHLELDYLEKLCARLKRELSLN